MIIFLEDVESALIKALKATFPEISVSTREPAKRPSPFIRLLIGASVESDVPIHEKLTFTVECWHETSEIEANKLAQKVRQEIARWGWEPGFKLSDSGRSALVVSTSTPRPVSYPPGDRWSRYTGTYQITLTRAKMAHF